MPKQGLEITYFHDGSINAEREVSEDGTWNGYYRVYRSNGSILFEQQYINNIKSGYEKHYFDNGLLRYEFTNVNGYREGEEIGYYENGTIAYNICYCSGERNGASTWFHMNGKVKCKIHYEEGKKVNEATWYYEDGSVREYIYYSPLTFDAVFSAKYENNKITEEAGTGFPITQINKTELELGDTLKVAHYVSLPPLTNRVIVVNIRNNDSIVFNYSQIITNNPVSYWFLPGKKGQYKIHADLSIESIDKRKNFYSLSKEVEVK